MGDLSEATDALEEVTGRCLDHLADREPELVAWVEAVTTHARAVEAAAQDLRHNIWKTRKNAGLD